MKKPALPSQVPIVQITDSEMFSQFDDLEGFLELFPHSDRDAEFIKKKVDNQTYILWVAHTDNIPVGYLIGDPKQPHSKRYAGYGFYVAERFVDEKYRNRLICSRLVGIASRVAKKMMHRKAIFEEVSMHNKLGRISSDSFGFEEFAFEKRDSQIYSLRRKPLYPLRKTS